MTVVSNTTPLIGLAAIGRFYLLEQLFGTLCIASAVYDEAVMKGRERGGAKREISAAQWIRVVEIEDRLAVEVLLDTLDLGEAETIVLASEIGASQVLMDEKKGRRKVKQLGLSRLGTVGILLRAKERGLIPSVQGDIERLTEVGFSLSNRLIEMVLARAGE